MRINKLVKLEMNNMCCFHKRNENGSAFVIVIIVIAVLSILSVVMLTLSLAETKATAYQDKQKQAYYLARSGTEQVAVYLIHNPDMDTELLGDDPVAGRTSEENTSFSNGTFNVKVAGTSGSSKINVKGTGNAGGAVKSAVAVMDRLKLIDIMDKAIYSDENLDIKNMKVKGDIQSSGTINYSHNGSNTYDDTKYHATPNEAKYVSWNTLPAVPTEYAPPNLTVNNNQTVTIDSSYSFTDLRIEQQGKLIIEMTSPNQEIVIYANNINIYGILEIIPYSESDTVSVKICVRNSFVVQTTGLINNDHPKFLDIFMLDGSVFDMQANMTLNGYITGPNATVYIQSDGSVINGYVYAESVSKSASNPEPNGAVNYVPRTDMEAIPDYLKGYKIIEWSE